jgi:hypothetical protein
MNSIQHRKPCKYQTVVGTNAIVPCANLAVFGSWYCEEHEGQMREIEEFEKEVERIVTGRTKK